MKLSKPVSENVRKLVRIGKREVEKVGIVYEVKSRPEDIGNKYGTSATAKKVGKVEVLRRIELIENAESGQEEKNWDGETRNDTEKCDELKIRRRVSEVECANVNGNDGGASDGANINDRIKMWFQG